jgi:hypothetical protein
VGGQPNIVSVLPPRPNFTANKIVCFIKVDIFLGVYGFAATYRGSVLSFFLWNLLLIFFAIIYYILLNFDDSVDVFIIKLRYDDS